MNDKERAIKALSIFLKFSVFLSYRATLFVVRYILLAITVNLC